MPNNVCDEITYPVPNFHGCIIEVWEVIASRKLWWVELLIHSGITMLIHVSRRGPRKHVTPPSVLWHIGTYPRLNCNNDLAKTPWMDNYNQ